MRITVNGAATLCTTPNNNSNKHTGAEGAEAEFADDNAEMACVSAAKQIQSTRGCSNSWNTDENKNIHKTNNAGYANYGSRQT